MADVDVGEVITTWRQWSSGSIDELAAVGTAFVWALGLEPLPETTATDRVSRRTIRYYISSGLMEPPEGERRLAVYRYRHLLQLIYIKARQHAGDRLDQVRELLAASKPDALEDLLLESLPDRIPSPLPDDPGEFARPAHLDAVLRRWAYLTGRRGRWQGPESRLVTRRSSGPAPESFGLVTEQHEQVAARIPGEQHRARSREVDSQELQHRVEVSIGDGMVLSLPADHPLVHDEDGRRQFLRGIRRMMRDYLSGNGPA